MSYFVGTYDAAEALASGVFIDSWPEARRAYARQLDAVGAQRPHRQIRKSESVLLSADVSLVLDRAD